MGCVFTSNVRCGMAQITVNAFDEPFGKWVRIQAHCPDINMGYMQSNLSMPPAQAAAIGAALIAAAKAAGWVEVVEAHLEVETVDAA